MGADTQWFQYVRGTRNLGLRHGTRIWDQSIDTVLELVRILLTKVPSFYVMCFGVNVNKLVKLILLD